MLIENLVARRVTAEAPGLEANADVQTGSGKGTASKRLKQDCRRRRRGLEEHQAKDKRSA